MTVHVSIGQVKRDISELVNRVAYRGERIVLTSRGKPKAVLVSVEDLARLLESERGPAGRAEWLASAQALAERIRQRRADKDLDVDALIQADKEDLERRHE